MNLIEQLKIEETKLMEKISKTENEGTYRNLIRNLSDVTQLRQREERELPMDKWTQMYSKYRTRSNDEDDFIPVISVWEQKGDEIRNHRIFEIKEEIKLNMDEVLDKLANSWNDIDEDFKRQICGTIAGVRKQGEFEVLLNHTHAINLDNIVNP